MTNFTRITQDPAVMGGKPCIRGLRVTVGMIVAQIGAGRAIDELLSDYPYLEREDVLEALRYAAWRGDFLALDRSLVEPEPGDLFAIMTAGAYGATQAGTYNTRALIPEVLVRKGEWALIRPRVTAEQLIGLDRLPEWL